MRRLTTTCFLLAVCLCTRAQFQGLIINELGENYVELLVVGKKTCTDSTVNLRGWILDDNNGWLGADAFGTHGDGGHLRLSSASLHWGQVKFGSIILIYNEQKRHPAIPPDDYIDANGDYLYVLPATVHLDQDNAEPAAGTSSFAGYNSWYVAGAQTTWDRVQLSPLGDAFIVVDPASPGKPHFSIAWGMLSKGADAALAAAGGFFGPGLILANGSIQLANDQFQVASNFSFSTSLTPGRGNTAVNQDWIDLMRGPVMPHLNITPPGVCNPGKPDLTGPAVTAGSSSNITLSYWWDEAATQPLSTPAAVDAGTYYIKAVNAMGCVTVKPVQAYISKKPPPPVLSAINGCAGNSTLTAGNLDPGAGVMWSTGQRLQPQITVNAAGTYSAVQDINGCFSEAATVVARPAQAPVLTYNASPRVCDASGFILAGVTKGEAPYQYSLNGGQLSATGDYRNLAAGTYSLAVTDATGCTTSQQVTIASSSVGGSIAAAQDLCKATGTITATVVGGTAPFSFSLNGGNFTSNPNFPNLPAGTYSVTIRDGTGCFMIANAKLDVTLPAIQASALPIPCGEQGSLAINVNNALSPVSYSLAGGGFTSTSQFNGLRAGTYSYTVREGNGCMYTSQVLIPEAPSPMQASVSLNQDHCLQQATLQAAVSQGKAPYAYSLDGSVFQTSPVFTVNRNGTYSITVKDAGGCMVSTQPTVVSLAAPFDVGLSADKPLARWGETVVISATANQTFQVVQWLPQGLKGNASRQTIKADTSFTAVIIGLSAMGCIDTAFARVEVEPLGDVFIPNAFTPNGDGRNDVFRAVGSRLAEARLQVFNRWGELVFQTQDLDAGWDGNYKGKPQPPGVFIYYLRYSRDGVTYLQKKGTVTLIR